MVSGDIKELVTEMPVIENGLRAADGKGRGPRTVFSQ